MKYVSFKAEGQSSYGIIHAKGVFDLGMRYGQLLPDLKAWLEAADLGLEPNLPKVLEADHRLRDIEHEVLIANPAKIICVGVNYEEHRTETGRSKSDYPTIFTRFADTLIGHREPIIRPQVSEALDFEGELAIVIGRGCYRVPQEHALDVIAGYTCFNDATLRDWQRHSHQFTPGKNFLSTGALGPELVTPDEVGELADLSIETKLNGTSVQSAKLGDMLFSVAEIIAYVTSFTPLAPGDIIATGTPGGVGFKREPALYMKDGDLIEVIIQKVGHLENHVEDEDDEMDA